MSDETGTVRYPGAPGQGPRRSPAVAGGRRRGQRVRRAAAVGLSAAAVLAASQLEALAPPTAGSDPASSQAEPGALAAALPNAGPSWSGPSSPARRAGGVVPLRRGPAGSPPAVEPAAAAQVEGAAYQLAAGGIPETALRAYRHAAAAAPAGCAISWTLVAAIGRVESDHGRFGGATLQPDGLSWPPIIGVPLNGAGRALIRDTDGGRLDGDPVYDRAVGPMQFIPSTWALYASDGDGDGQANPFDINDAAAAAVSYLCAAGGDLTSLDGQRRAVLAYNHSADYVATVLTLAAQYAGTAPPVLPPEPAPPAPVIPPANPAPPPAAHVTSTRAAPASPSRHRSAATGTARPPRAPATTTSASRATSASGTATPSRPTSARPTRSPAPTSPAPTSPTPSPITASPTRTSPATTSPTTASPTTASPTRTSPTRTSPTRTSPATTSPARTSPATRTAAPTPSPLPTTPSACPIPAGGLLGAVDIRNGSANPAVATRLAERLASAGVPVTTVTTAEAATSTVEYPSGQAAAARALAAALGLTAASQPAPVARVTVVIGAGGVLPITC
jgi:membrane-bound lytic murein transglycosylase B